MEIKEVNEKYLNKIYLNILKAIIFITYFLIINLAYENVSVEYMEIGIKIFSMIFLFISIYIFERAYKKDDGDLVIQGIEILVLSAYTLTTTHVTNKFNFGFKNYSLVASYMYAIYFILKSIIIYTKGRKELVDNLSDIREIVKKEEPAKKEATKKKKKENEEKEIDDNKKNNYDMNKQKISTKKRKSNTVKSKIKTKSQKSNNSETKERKNKKLMTEKN